MAQNGHLCSNLWSLVLTGYFCFTIRGLSLQKWIVETVPEHHKFESQWRQKSCNISPFFKEKASWQPEMVSTKKYIERCSKIDWRTTTCRGTTIQKKENSPLPGIWIHLNNNSNKDTSNRETNQGLKSVDQKIVISMHPRLSQKSNDEDCSATIIEPDLAQWYNRWTQSWWLSTLTDTLWLAETMAEWDKIKGGSYSYCKNPV